MRKLIAYFALALLAATACGCCCDDQPNDCNSCGPVTPTVREGGHGWR